MVLVLGVGWGVTGLSGVDSSSQACMQEYLYGDGQLVAGGEV